MILRTSLMGAALVLLAWAPATEGNEETAFRASSEYALQLGDQTIEGVEVFYSPRQVSYLVVSDQLERPLIVRIPEEIVVEVSPEAVEMDPLEGLAKLVAGASEKAVGGFKRRKQEIRFQIGETPAALVPAPPIVGWHTPQTLRSRDLVLRSGFARAEKSRLAAKEFALPTHRELLVEVFFGSWDEYSQQVMPAIMRLEEELSTGSVFFRYYGLPRRIADDPLGVERSIHGVPTLIVSADGDEIGRLTGRALAEPSESLQGLLAERLQ